MKYPLNVGDSFKNTYGNRATVQRIAANDEVTLLTDKNTKYTEHKDVLEGSFDAGMYTDFIFVDGSLDYKDVVQGNVYRFNHENGSYILGQFYYEGYIRVGYSGDKSEWVEGILRCTNTCYHHKIVEASGEDSDWYWKCRGADKMVANTTYKTLPPSLYKTGDCVRIISGGHYFTESGLENPNAAGDKYRTTNDDRKGSIIRYAYSHLHQKWYYKLDCQGNMVSEDGLELTKKTKPTMPRTVKTKPKFKGGDDVRIIPGGNYVIPDGIEKKVALSKDLLTTNNSSKQRVESSVYSYLHDLWWYKIKGHNNMYSEPGLELYEEVKVEPVKPVADNLDATEDILVFGKFKIGQKVECTNSDFSFRTVGKVYTVLPNSDANLLRYKADDGSTTSSTLVNMNDWTSAELITNTQFTGDNHGILSNLAAHAFVGSVGEVYDNQDIVIPLHNPTIKLDSNTQVDLVNGPTKFAFVKLEEEPENNYLTL